MRGYILNNLLTVTNKYVALLISSALFAALHSMNPGLSATPIGKPMMSGGDFGFEGSVVCTILCAALAILIIIFYERKSIEKTMVGV